eukprot:CAMPEP_0197521510 /NCGR_PEP_ID=MMETSP1318-20131121/6782_1 /TAXON_ID=552666 /ORGANISM="Partenskyella glossopodia, Strain RCC365" /LENGTH=356 /DNA_ID=CAMNT_0043073533 /DNA_START=340 /DNA_END=1410 /DNA_ORIENTATION=+
MARLSELQNQWWFMMLTKTYKLMSVLNPKVYPKSSKKEIYTSVGNQNRLKFRLKNPEFTDLEYLLNYSFKDFRRMVEELYIRMFNPENVDFDVNIQDVERDDKNTNAAASNESKTTRKFRSAQKIFLKLYKFTQNFGLEKAYERWRKLGVWLKQTNDVLMLEDGLPLAVDILETVHSKSEASRRESAISGGSGSASSARPSKEFSSVLRIPTSNRTSTVARVQTRSSMGVERRRSRMSMNSHIFAQRGWTAKAKVKTDNSSDSHQQQQQQQQEQQQQRTYVQRGETVGSEVSYDAKIRQDHAPEPDLGEEQILRVFHTDVKEDDTVEYVDPEDLDETDDSASAGSHSLYNDQDGFM